MRESGVRGILVYCGDYHCSHSAARQQGQRKCDAARSANCGGDKASGMVTLAVSHGLPQNSGGTVEPDVKVHSALGSSRSAPACRSTPHFASCVGEVRLGDDDSYFNWHHETESKSLARSYQTVRY